MRVSCNKDSKGRDAGPGSGFDSHRDLGFAAEAQHLPPPSSTMHRFFVPGIQDTDVEIQLPEAEARHASRVLRIQPGETLLLLDGAGGEHRGEVTAVGRRDVAVRLTEHRHQPQRPCEITLVQAVAKGPAMEGLLHRAVELGCSRLVPLVSERSVSRPDDPTVKQERWQALAIEAAKQSGNPWLMTVEAPITPAEWLRRPRRHELLLVASLEDAAQHPHLPLLDHRQRTGNPPRSVAVLIGPEGDFSPAEYAAFRAAGAQPISLGPHVLRVETAATAVLAVLACGIAGLREEMPSSVSPRGGCS
jgi:16S rRNA (uracil1498-N3)-methyltransferase